MPTANLLGIENLKKAVKFGIDLGEQIESSGKDGWSWTDAFSFFDEVMQVPGLISKGDEIAEEFKDLVEAEHDELIEYVKAEFNIDDKKAEGRIESAVNIFLAIYILVKQIRQENKPPVTPVVP